MRLDLVDLHLFLCIVDAGSITAGANRAHLALASASERVRKIESAAGVALLERRPKGVVTTEAGEALAHHARLILRQQEMLKGELQDFAMGARGTLHLYANTAALTEFLPSRLSPWLVEHPCLRVELKERTSADIVRAVASGLAEAGIVSNAIKAEGLEQQPVMKDHLALIVPHKHALTQYPKVCFADVLDQPFVGLAQGSALQDHINDQARTAGRLLDLRIRMKTYEGVCEMVSHGVGIGILPQSVAKRYRRRHSYATLLLTDAWARRQLCLCFREWKVLSAPMQRLLTHLGTSQGKPNVSS